MIRIAVKMLLHDRVKYLSLIFGVAFSTLLIAQQSAIFSGAMTQSHHAIDDAPAADIWVMRPSVESLEDHDPMPDSFLTRVRGVEGVAWALPYYKTAANLRTGDGRKRSVMLIGIDDASLSPAPRQMLSGRVQDLYQPDAIIMDQAAWTNLFEETPRQLGAEFEIGRRRAVVVGFCKSSPAFNGMPLIFARRATAVAMAQEADNSISFILVHAKPGTSTTDLAHRLSESTGLLALTRQEFADKTISYVVKYSGISEVLGITIALGVVVGIAIVGQTFYMFSVENIRQFAALKAIGINNRRVLSMVILQSAIVAAIGYAIGIGLACLFFVLMATDSSPLRGMTMPPTVMFGSAGLVFAMVMLSGLISARKVLVVDPALVFR